MNAGRILRVGAPMELYLKPAVHYVADFIGTTNNLPARPAGDGRLRVEGGIIQATVPDALAGRDRYVVCVRPEHFELAPAGDDALTGRLESITFLGQTVRAWVVTEGDQKLVADLSTSEWMNGGLAVGDQVTWSVRPGAAMVFSADDESTYSPAAEERPVGAS